MNAGPATGLRFSKSPSTDAERFETWEVAFALSASAGTDTGRKKLAN